MEEKEILNTENAAPIAEEAPEVAPEKEAVQGEAAPVAEAAESGAGADGEKTSDEKGGDGKKPMSKKKRILNAIFLGVQIALVIFALILTIVMIMNPKQGEVSSAGIKLLPVLSDSMDGERTIDGVTYKGFPEGALVIAKGPHEDGVYKVGDIVTFEFLKDDKLALNTHRIVEIVTTDGVVKYRTQGDNPKYPVDTTLKLPGNIKAVYVTHINGLGTALTWIRDGYHFIYVIIIPLGLLLIYNIYLVAQIVIESKMKKANAAAAEKAKQAALASIDEEEIKRRAIEEYLKSQAATAESNAPHDDGGTK